MVVGCVLVGRGALGHMTNTCSIARHSSKEGNIIV